MDRMIQPLHVLHSLYNTYSITHYLLFVKGHLQIFFKNLQEQQSICIR